MFSTTEDRTPRLGVLRGDAILEVRTLLTDAGTGTVPDTLERLLDAGPDAWARVTAAAEHAETPGIPAAQVTWHAPFPRPAKNVICLGMNYAEHVREAAGAMGRDPKLPKAPVYFTKAPTSVIGPYDDIVVDQALTQQVDWEAELGVVIGVGGRNIPADRALEHVFGYTVINDVSARDLQRLHTQFFKGKSLDTFCPMGPVVVTADEFGDPQTKAVRLRVNGVMKQDGKTSDMIFDVATIVSTFSQGLTLEPGDIFSTGTPDGVGMGRTPQEWLQPGDVVEAEVEGIGSLRNHVIAARVVAAGAAS